MVRYGKIKLTPLPVHRVTLSDFALLKNLHHLLAFQSLLLKYIFLFIQMIDRNITNPKRLLGQSLKCHHPVLKNLSCPSLNIASYGYSV